MSTEPTSGVKGVWHGREIVDAETCDRWRQRVHDGDAAAAVARDDDEWAYATIHDHVRGETCTAHGENQVPPAETDTSPRGLPVASAVQERSVRDGLRDALDANYAAVANVTIHTLRTHRGVDVQSQTVGVIVRELVDGDPTGEFDVRATNPDSQTGRWTVRYAGGGSEWQALLVCRTCVNTQMTKRLTVDMDEDLYHKFGVECAKESVTKADVVRDCVGDWVGDE